MFRYILYKPATMNTYLASICAVLFLLFSACQLAHASKTLTNHTAEPQIIRHAVHNQQYLAKRERYFIELLQLAIKKSGSEYLLQGQQAEPHSEKRAAQYLSQGKFDVQWLNTSTDMEENLLPIRIPLYKGLVGWRIFIIRKEDEGIFSTIKNIDDLKQFRALQGDSWPDTEILREHDIDVETSTDYLTLSLMLHRKRGDFFPRAIPEVWQEISNYRDFSFTVDRTIALHYPAAYYFFVHKRNAKLASAIQRGLENAILDGSFDTIFWKHFKSALKQSDLTQRTIISIPNPTLPPETPLRDKHLWFSIDDIPK